MLSVFMSNTAEPSLIDQNIFYIIEGSESRSWATWHSCPVYLCSVEPPAPLACRQSATAAPGRLLHDWLLLQTLGQTAAPSSDPGAVREQLCTHPDGPMPADWKEDPKMTSGDPLANDMVHLVGLDKLQHVPNVIKMAERWEEGRKRSEGNINIGSSNPAAAVWFIPFQHANIFYLSPYKHTNNTKTLRSTHVIWNMWV